MPARPETSVGPFITDSRSVTPDQLQAIAGITGGVVATSNHDFDDILYLKYGQNGYERGASIGFAERDREGTPSTRIQLYGYPLMEWSNPRIEVGQGKVTIVCKDWISGGDKLVITKEAITLVIERPADPIPQSDEPLV